jgi:uncharacterized membrane protein SirB2
MYIALKHLHLTLIVIAFSLFLLRSFWLMTGSTQLQKKLFKILPHPINLVMILSGFAVAGIGSIPLSSPWIIAKLVALVAFIALGLLTFKQTTKTKQMLFFSAAFLTFVYICSVAVTKSPMGVFGVL